MYNNIKGATTLISSAYLLGFDYVKDDDDDLFIIT